MPPQQEVLAFLFSQLPGGPTLNLGAGMTGFAEVGRTVVNVDNRLYEPRGSGSFVVADANCLPFRTGSFANALLKDVIEHVDEPIGLLTEVRRVVRDGGELVVTTPRAIARAVWDDPTHVRGFTTRALLVAVAAAGWEPTAKPRRIGSVPGAGRLHLVPWLPVILRIPVVGHWFGTNHLLYARAARHP
jgi:SAM-dependent methyltransferase